MNEVNPEKTYALVVGVEKYQDAPDLDGPGRDAMQFAIWLLNRDVHPNNIGLFISPLAEEQVIQEVGEKQEIFNQINRNPATFENIRNFIYDKLHNQSQPEDLLYVFWSGHGLITPAQEQTERRLLFSDFSNTDPRNLNLNSLVNSLKFPQRNQGFKQQIYLIDACAHINKDSNQYQASELKFTPLSVTPKKQYILFAVTEGATAINKKSEGGKFSQALLSELENKPLLPDLDQVAIEVKTKLTSDGMKPTFWKRDWFGKDEENLYHFHHSDTPTPEEQKKIICQFLEKIENEFKDIKLFHLEQKTPLNQQYIPIQVTLERRYKKSTEAIGSYAESEAEMKQIYALKGIDEEAFQKQQVDWEEARKEHQKIMVLADPGMGKSTLLKMEALRIAQDEREKLEAGKITVEEVVLPLFLRLSELASELNKSEFLPEAIADVLKLIYLDKTDFDKIQSLIVEKIKKGQCFVLLDAWDEVEQEHRTKLKNKLDNFKQIDCPIIATSRIVGYGNSPIGGAKEVEIVPFSQQQTENYIETWFENAKGYLEDESVSADNLIKELQDRPQINGLVKNPLLLSLICSLYQTKELELPAKRSEIYKQAVDCILQTWRNQRQEQKTVDIDFKKEVLESFAYQISREGKEVFNLRELRKKIRSFLQQEGYPQVDPIAIITELSEEDGIIQQIDKDGEKYIFLHRTFQEYFTASYLNESEDPMSLAQQFFWNYDQHETLTLLAGLMDDPTPLIQAIYQEKDDIFKTQLLLGGRCLAECSDRALEPSLTTDIVENIHKFWLSYRDASFITSTVVALAKVNSEAVEALIAALKDSDLEVKRYAAEALVNIGNPEAVEGLIAALKDSDLEVKRYAAFALVNIGNAEAVQGLIAALNDSDSDVKRYAAFALVNIGNAEAVQALIAALHDSDSRLRGSAAEALGKIGNVEAVKPLIAALNDSDSNVRGSAAEALGKIGNGEAVEALIAALKDSDDIVRWKAAEALVKIGNVEGAKHLIAPLNYSDSQDRWKAILALGKIGNVEGAKGLIAALNCSNSQDRWKAILALGKIGNVEAVKLLIYALNDSNYVVRRSAAEALGHIGNSEAVEALIAALIDSNSNVRWKAAEALGKIGNDEAVEGLIAALKDSDSDVRLKAAEALGKIGNGEAVKPLIAALNDSDSDVRWSAAEALSKIGNAKALKPLIAALNDSDSSMRRSAAFALGQIGNPEAVKPLIAALKDSDSDVKRSAAKALGEIGNAEAVEALIAALHDSDSSMRRSAAFALGQIGNPEAVKPLIAALKDSDSDVKRSAAKALGEIGNAEAVEGLIAALKDSDSDVKRSAAKALGQIGNPEAVEGLIAALKDSDLEVRWKAAEALGQIGNGEAVKPLITALDDSDSVVRLKAAKALGKIGNAEAVQGVITALDDSDSYVRLKAAKALGKIGNAEAVQGVITALKDSNSDVRESAVKALGNIGNPEAVEGLIAALKDSDSSMRRSAAFALGQIGNAEVLKQLLQNPTVNIYESKLFYVARRIAIRFSQKNYEFIPVYPKYVVINFLKKWSDRLWHRR